MRCDGEERRENGTREGKRSKRGEEGWNGGGRGRGEGGEPQEKRSTNRKIQMEKRVVE